MLASVMRWKLPRDYVGETRLPKRPGLANLPRTSRCLGVHAKQKTSTRHLLHNKAIPVRAKTMSADTCTITRQLQPEQVVVGNIRPCRKKNASRHEERRLSAATRQIALTLRDGTTSVPPNSAAGMQTDCTDPNTHQPRSQHQVCCHWQSEGVLGAERYRWKTIRNRVKTPPTNSTPLEMLAPKSHTSLAKMDLRRMKEGAMWRTGYVDTVNLPSHMPTMKRRQPTSGL